MLGLNNWGVILNGDERTKPANEVLITKLSDEKVDGNLNLLKVLSQ